jgi:hypothetical protein
VVTVSYCTVHAGSSGSSSDTALALRAGSKASPDCEPDAAFLKLEPVVLSSSLRQFDENPTEQCSVGTHNSSITHDDSSPSYEEAHMQFTPAATFLQTAILQTA